NRNKWRNKLIESLYQLACCLAWQEVASQETRTDKVSLHRLPCTAFDGVVANYHLKAYPRDRLFCHFPERNWPLDFLAKIAEERAKMPTASWMGKACHVELRHRSAEEIQSVFFGNKIQLAASGARAFIISSLNPHWVEAADLPSGHTRSDFYRSLWMQLWKPDCHRCAVGSVMKAKARGDQELTLHQKLHAVEQARQKNMDAGERDWGDFWRPVSWLTWVIAGLPCSESEGFVMDTLGVGRPGTATATTEALNTRQQRKAERRAAGGGRGDGAVHDLDAPAGARADMSVRHDLHIVHERPVVLPLTEQAFKIRKLRDQEILLSKQMEVLTKMGPLRLQRLQEVQELYLRVTDDIFQMSEEVQESARNNLMREHEVAALLLAPGQEAFLPLQASSSSSSSSTTL
ncbi:hypothetical protein B484DRAFT_459715, partial [Ochromonadaceae sp. CCMP2298]